MRLIWPIPSLARLAATNRVPPVAAMYRAMARLAVITIPKWAMSILKTWVSGMNKGAVSSVAGSGSELRYRELRYRTPLRR